MNPPTSGHERLADKIESVAKEKGGMPHIFLSHSNDKNKNPLPYLDKIKLASKAFGKMVIRSRAKTVIDVMKELPMTLLLRPFSFETYATFTYQYAKDEMIEAAAAPALMIVCAGLIPVFIANRALKT